MNSPVNMWGMASESQMGVALPMANPTPPLNAPYNLLVGLNSTNTGFEYKPVGVDLNGSIYLPITGDLFINGQQVVGPRRTGWIPPTGTFTRNSFNTASVTLPQLAERVAALIEDLQAHGLINP